MVDEIMSIPIGMNTPKETCNSEDYKNNDE